jgi:hypothetical protein
MIYELVIDDEEIDEVFSISLVKNPAMEANWVYFNKEKEIVRFATLDNEKRIIVAPVLIPNKQILRVDGEGKNYYVFFNPETIEKLAQKYIAKGYQSNATLEHKDKINGSVTVVESWVSKDSVRDKSNIYFGNQYPEGTWFVSWKVNDSKLWDEYIKTGDVQGASIEGLFGHNLVSAAKEDELYLSKEISDLSEQEAAMVLSKIKAMFESYADYGDEIKNNAKRGIELNEKNNNKCATQTGKVRAQQLADGEAISVETIKRMYSYLSRAETYYDETDTNACGTISYLLWGGKSALSWSRNKLKELGLLEEQEAQPSISSTYPGENVSGSIAPALLAEECPVATQNIGVNLYNRQTAIRVAMYGPLDIKNPGDYWEKIADKWNVPVEEAKGEICGNCAAFNIKKEMLSCIQSGIGGKVEDALDVIEAGDLGYCEFFDFKCNANRSCTAHVDGGPLKD